jgi:hypothetical protein
MVNLSRHLLNKFPATLIVTLLCVITICSLQLSQLNKLGSDSQTASAAQINKELESEKQRLNILYNLPSFGFHNLVADWTFLNFLQYFGDEPARAKTSYKLSPEYFEVIFRHDPYFLRAYNFLSISTTLYSGMPEKTVALMEEGLKHMSPKVPSKSYYLWRYKGIDELLFVGNAQAAKKSFETAAQWASNYSDAESKSVANISHQTAKLIEKNPESKSAQISAWSMVLNSAFDDNTRKLAINRIRALGGKISITPQGEVRIILPKKD